MNLLETIEVSGSPGADNIDFTAFNSSLYVNYLVLGRWQPEVDNETMAFRVSNDGGSTFKSGASDYRGYCFTHGNAAEGAGRFLSDVATDRIIGPQAFNNVDYGLLKIWLINFHSTTFRSTVAAGAHYIQPSDTDLAARGGGMVDAAENNDGFRIFIEGGTKFQDARLSLYGV